MNINTERLVGKRIGGLVVVAFHAKKRGNYQWVCLCDCGREFLAWESGLVGDRRSCGCLKTEDQRKRATTHGMSKTITYRAWAAMVKRCENPNVAFWHRYGGRGIKVCDRWRSSFESFFEDMGERPSKKHSIDRINNDGNYEPSNCRWATQSQQNSNRHGCKPVSINGVVKPLADWCRELCRDYSKTYARIKRGIAPEVALEIVAFADASRSTQPAKASAANG